MKTTLLNKSNFPITRYSVPLTSAEWGHFTPFKFKSIDDTLDQSGVGWVSPQCPFEPERDDLTGCQIDNLLYATIRFDERLVSNSLLAKHTAIAEGKMMRETQAPKLSKGRRAEIKENEYLKLLKKTSPVTKLFEVVWRTDTEEVWLLANSARSKALFEELFFATFGLIPVELVHYNLAQLLVTPEQLDKVTSTVSEETVLVDIIAEKQDLAKDFMLWLWWGIDTDYFSSPEAQEEEKEEVLGVPLIHLVSDDGEETVVCKGGEEMREAMEALRQDKRPVQFSFVINDYMYTVRAPALSIHSLNVGSPHAEEEKGEDGDAQALIRAEAIGSALGRLDHYYKMWLEQAGASTTMPKIRNWIFNEEGADAE